MSHLLRNAAHTAAIALAFATVSLPETAAQGTARSGTRLLTIDDIYDPDNKKDFGGSPPSGLVWLSDTHYLWPKPVDGGKATEWLRVEALTGRSTPWYDPARMERALTALPGVAADDAKRVARQRGHVIDDKKTSLLITIADDLYHYAIDADRAVRLSYGHGKEEEPSVSPDGRLVAFVRGGNLHIVDVATQRERAVTSDGSADVLNGKLDWVYQEEVYGRGHFRAYWWSPDSSRIAFLRIDQRQVPKFTLEDHIPYRLEVENWGYPKAGDPNPIASLAVARASGGEPRLVALDKYAAAPFLIVDVGWTPDAAKLWFQVQDREQTWLDLNTTPAAGGEATTLLRETTPAWVDNIGPPVWLGDGSFLWRSDRSGFRHIYHLKNDGALLRPVTAGKWEARTLHGVDEKTGLVYFSGTEKSPIGSDVYRVKLDGSGLRRLSTAPGTHSANFNPSFTRYVDSWNDVTTPTQVRLHQTDGSEIRTLEANRVAALDDYRLSRPEFVQVKTRDGFVMEAMLIKPPQFDPARRYPVYQHTYAGPHAPQVRNAWAGTSYMFHQMLAQRGIVVWICDNRSASGKGAESVWPAYKRLGELELQDIEDGIAWLRQQSWVDPARIGINGWSYGGFMVSYALTHSTSFAMGIAGGPVTDWRNYDSIYTERYMRVPQNNPEGYKRTAPRFAAKDLHGRLLLLHGTMDDNVHMQNTLQFAYELQKAGKPFRLMAYPKSRHGITEPALAKHLRQTMFDFVLETLQPDTPAATPAAAAAR